MTLTQTAILVKQIITFSTVALVLGIISFIGYKIWYANYLANLPPVEEKPDIKFGLLPQLVFSKSTVSTSNYTYSLETTTGGLPKVGIDPGFEKFVKIYFVTRTVATLLSSEKSQNLAEKFGISASPVVLSETKYKFSDNLKNLLVDLDTGNFSYSKEATISGKLDQTDENNLILGFQQTLSSLAVFNEDLRSGRTKVTFLKSDGNNLVPTQVKSEAITALISIWPSSIDKKGIFTENNDKSTVSAIVVGSSNQIANYLSLDFNYYKVDTSTFATYPLKTADTAFSDLQNGKGVVVVEPEKPQVSISLVYLGYYLPEDYSPYLQPIYIFEGAHFIAYVSAVSAEFQAPATEN